MADKTDGGTTHKRRSILRVVGLVLLLLVAGVAVGMTVLAVTGKTFRLPRAVLAMAEQQIDFGLRRAGTLGARVSVGGVTIAVEPSFRPQISVQDIRVADRDGAPVLVLPEAQVVLTRPTLWNPIPRPRRVILTGARVDVARRPDGRFDLALGVAPGGAPITDYKGVIEEIRAALNVPMISQLQLVEVSDVFIGVSDERANRRWELQNGSLVLDRPDGAVRGVLTVGLSGTERGRIDLTVLTDPEKGTSALDFKVDDVRTTDIAAQAAPLTALSILDAPVSGTMSAALDGSGSLFRFQAALDLGAGALWPQADLPPIPFDAASMALAYDPQAERVVISDASISGRTLRAKVEGQAYLRDLEQGIPNTVLGQIHLQDVAIDPRGLFTEAVHFSEGQMDARLHINPFSLEIGQVALTEGDRVLRGHGRVSADSDGWRVAFDPSLNQIKRDELLALWPPRLVPKTREWLSENVLGGDLQDVHAALRIAPNEEARLALGYSFAGGDVRFLRTLPPIESGEGYAAIFENRYAMALVKGHLNSPEGGVVTADGSSLVVPDLRDRPIRVEIDLAAHGSLTAALSLLDQPPFQFLTKAKRDPNIGTGEAEVRARLQLPLLDKIEPDDVNFDIKGTIHDFRSGVLVPDRVLTADTLHMTAVPDALSINGSGYLGPVPFDAAFTLPLAPGPQTGAVRGTAQISRQAATYFGIDLPDGLISGTATGRFDVELPPGMPPQLSLTSDLKGITAGLAALGWSKPANAAGKLAVDVDLDTPPKVERLEVEGGGLRASGSVTLQDGGQLEAARLSRVRLNGWLDAPVVLRGRGKGVAPAVEVGRGKIDLRRLNLGTSGSTGQGNATTEDIPIRTALAEVRVSDTLALTDVVGAFRSAGGLQGTFRGRVNGGAPLSGTLGAAANGTEVRLTAADAGGVLSSSGIFSNATGGPMQVILTPRVAKGEYDGTLLANDIRIHDLPLPANMVNALSGVGAVEQLAGGGILFTNVDAGFRLTPDAIEVTRSAAVGSSLGVTAEGVYRMADKRFFMQGVVSPIYFLNGGGQPGGEGLFGVTYRLRGTASDPEISVNPLSLLAIGPFRDLIQGPAPRLAE
ncbi:DUF3971 domain-containing protein [Falsirhodobacter sp. alg1]|uniref:YhdP family protein n=1 Tax=Falsirhodobacter sp. alg1 TaxID=1472418 RepID=UPI00178CD1C8|nr:DUF3971 domain-containing protein [Falsirhodobacter sp. alg1]